MPFYEYECSACKYYVEALRKISDPPLIKCPSCNKETLQRLLSVPVFRLKGSGWYETDFKSEKEQKRNIAGEPEAAPEKKEGDDTSKPVVRTRKKTSITAKTTSAPASSPSIKAPVKTAVVAAAKAVAKPVKKAAKKAAKKSARKPIVKPIAKNKSARKTDGKQKAVKKTSKAARKPKSAAKKK